MSQKPQLLIRYTLTNYNCDLNSVSELRCFLNSLNTSFRSQSLENSRLISEANELRKRNDHFRSRVNLPVRN